MERGDGAYALEFVDVSAGIDQTFAEKCLRWAVAEQEKPFWSNKTDVLPRDRRIILAILPGKTRSGRVHWGKGGAVGLIRLDSEGPCVYTAERVGRKGQRFRCYKFRTMIRNADRTREELRRQNQRQGPCFKLCNDPRVTRVGRFLRRYSLDELPQLWNVIRGDMSLVGPRPHPLDDCARYDLGHLRRLDATPGMTGLWQITARQAASFETNLQLDLQYIEHWSLGLDLKILAKTLFVVLRGTGT